MSTDEGSAQRKETTGEFASPQNADKKPALQVVPGPGRKEFFRQTRYQNDLGLLRIDIAGKVVTLKNWSRTGLAFELPQNQCPFTVDQELRNVTISSSDIKIFEGDIKIISVRPGLDEHMIIGATFLNSLFLVEGVHSANVVNECAYEVVSTASAIMNCSPEFCRILLAFNSALRRFESACVKEEQRWRNLPFDQRLEAEKIFLPNLSAKMHSLFTDFDVQIAKLIDVEDLPEKSIYHALVNEHIYSYFEKADLARRAYEKPRGYAGDYEMMNQIYRGAYEGTTLFGKVLHNYITNEHSGESVKFRKPYLHDHLKQQLTHAGVRNVLAIASGPAVEYQEAVQTWSGEDLNRLHITLFDLDREALEHAQSKIMDISSKRGVSPTVNYVNASVRSFLATQSHASNGSFDLIYSAGLFDYLDNATSAALTQKFYGMLNPGGKLIIGNFTKDNLTKAFLHLIANWTLIHKTKEEILDWAKTIKDCKKSIEFDKNNMIAFLILEKNGNS